MLKERTLTQDDIERLLGLGPERKICTRRQFATPGGVTVLARESEDGTGLYVALGGVWPIPANVLRRYFDQD
jgi:hypothetical protein